MKIIETKFVVGDLVNHFTGVPGMITAVFHRGGDCTYEMTFLQDDKPTCINAQNCELCLASESSMGFKGQKNDLL